MTEIRGNLSWLLMTGILAGFTLLGLVLVFAAAVPIDPALVTSPLL